MGGGGGEGAVHLGVSSAFGGCQCIGGYHEYICGEG